MRNYKIRINVRPLRNNSDKLYSYVALSEDVVKMFDGKSYVSVKRMQDRLAFVPWDSKAEGRGTVAISNNVLQFGVQSDCEKMQDFCGEYNLVNKTDNGVVFVKLDDRKPFTKEFEGTGSKHDSAAEPVVVVQPASIKDVLQDAIERKKKEVEKAAEEVVAAENLLAEAKERLAKISDELSAYYVVLNAEAGVT